MTSLDGAIAHWTDQLTPLGRISARKMFGGAALYCDGQVFALLGDDKLYLKVDGLTRADYDAEGCGPFVYSTKEGEHTMGAYHVVPDRLLDDTDELLAWARKAVAVGVRAKQAQRPGMAGKGPRPGASGPAGMRNKPKINRK